MKSTKFLFITIFVVTILVLISCMPGGGHNSVDEPAGFFMGIWHGWIAPVSLIFGLFKPEISIYEINNTGWWYNFGFYMAIVAGFGSLSLARRKSKKRE